MRYQPSPTSVTGTPGNQVTEDQLVTLVADELAGLGDNPDLLNVVVRGDKRGQSGTINGIVRALSRIQVRRIRIAVQVPD